MTDETPTALTVAMEALRQARAANDTSEIKVSVAKLVEQFKAHAEDDEVIFKDLKGSQENILGKIDALHIAVTNATTAGIVQKTQISTGTTVLKWIGGLAIGIVTILTFVFSHKWG